MLTELAKTVYGEWHRDAVRVRQWLGQEQVHPDEDPDEAWLGWDAWVDEPRPRQ
jgi:hypothetical protein